MTGTINTALTPRDEGCPERVTEQAAKHGVRPSLEGNGDPCQQGGDQKGKGAGHEIVSISIMADYIIRFTYGNSIVVHIVCMK
ncbi:hypothetical protein FJV80_05115 [Mesorhizobium sp. WSM4310]|nr:hypothetical protein FJV80_05115 [Mesorhizobium sp. WSM4310]